MRAGEYGGRSYYAGGESERRGKRRGRVGGQEGRRAGAGRAGMEAKYEWERGGRGGKGKGKA